MKKCENILLVGFMGTGKSSIAREIAKSLNIEMIDTDEVIATREGCSISDVFEKHGEEYFRNLETEILSELLESDRCTSVISLGGGTPMREENRAVIKKLGYVVWLDTSAEDTYERVKGNSDRPLLKVEKPLKRIKELLQERRPVYKAVSQIRIKTSGLTVSEISNGVIDSASYHFSEH